MKKSCNFVKIAFAKLGSGFIVLFGAGHRGLTVRPAPYIVRLYKKAVNFFIFGLRNVADGVQYRLLTRRAAYIRRRGGRPALWKSNSAMCIGAPKY